MVPSTAIARQALFRALAITIGLLIALAFAEPAAAETPAFDWEAPARLGPDFDGDGLIDYSDTAAATKHGPFVIELEVRPDLCEEGATYSWSIDGEATGGGRGECDFRYEFSAEGSYDVALEVKSADGSRMTHTHPVTVQDWLVVAIGDSVSSGEGNPDSKGLLRRARWQSARCHRSTRAASVEAALALEASDPKTSVTLVHLGCSGAALRKGLLAGYRGIEVAKGAKPDQLPPQVSELAPIAAKRKIDAVVVNIGANDVHFGAIVEFCMRFKNCIERNFDPANPDRGKLGPNQARRLPVVVRDSLARLRTGYAELSEYLVGVTDPESVLIVDYFDPTRNQDGVTCEKIGVKGIPHYYIDRAEARWAYSHVLAPLNRTIGAAAVSAEWTEVTGVAESFRNHGYCAGNDSWIRSLRQSLFSQAGATRSSRIVGFLHPNGEGHRQIAALLGGAMQRHLYAAGNEPGTVDDEGVDEDAEGAAAIGLLAAIAVAALALGAGAMNQLRRRSSGASGGTPAQNTTPIALPESWPAADTVQAFGVLLESSAEWVHRRVESIELLDERTIRRRVSVDFTPTPGHGGSRPTHVPIALLHKEVLTRFDLRDEAGSSLPLLTAGENAAFATQHMLNIAAEASGSAGVPDRLRELCWVIARGEPWEAEEAIEEIANRLQPRDLREKLRGSQLFRSVTATFAQSFAVIVAFDDPDTTRRVIKFAYDDVLGGGPKLLARLGIAPATLFIRLPELGDAGSRHVEFLRARGLEAIDTRLVARTPAKKPLLRRVSPGVRRESHIFVSGAPRGTRGLVGIRLRAKRQGILVAGPLMASLAAVALTAAWFSLPELARDSSGAASVLLAVPAALGAYLGARDPHPFVAAVLTGVRSLLVLSGVLSFAAAGALALDSSVDTLRFVLGITALLSWLTALGLVTAYFLPPTPTWKRHPGEE